MIIKSGFNDKPTRISISPRDGSERLAELWIEQEGLVDEVNSARHSETLAFITLDELLDLQHEVKTAIQAITQ